MQIEYINKKSKRGGHGRIFYVKCPTCKKKVPKGVIIKSGFFICPYCHGDIHKFRY